MSFHTWPEPPIRKGNIPEIPEKFTIFGITYKNKNGNPSMDLPNLKPKELDVIQLNNLLDDSINQFKSLLTTFDSKIINEIEKIHIEINEMINKAICYNQDYVIKKAKNIKIEQKNKLINDLKDKLSL